AGPAAGAEGSGGGRATDPRGHGPGALPGSGAASGPAGRPWVRPAGLLLAICAYVALFVPLGFVLSTTLFVFGTAWYLGFANHRVSLLTGAGVALVLYLAMSEGLDVALPTGPLPF
ncbi:tripartite tricarboxylate transporter TctB family protein, partial [Streptomyces sp. MUM 203J]|uniref:tripartite tricarboxylate transporter TctB family protein n=1 Tax=Streptomyces sp. MUM 203J TaxID=2791990 RepID=UPI001F043851